MIATQLDATDAFNAAGLYVADLSGWDFAVVQLVTPAGAVTFTESNDAGAVTGVTHGNAVTATNFVSAALLDLSSTTGALVASSAAAGNFKYSQGARFLKLSGTTAAKILIQLSKID